MRMDETLSEIGHQEVNNDNKVQFTNISLHIFLRIKGNAVASSLQSSYVLQFYL